MVEQQVLLPAWDEYHPGWSYWKDVGINIGGFIPLGFVSTFQRLNEVYWRLSSSDSRSVSASKSCRLFSRPETLVLPISLPTHLAPL